MIFPVGMVYSDDISFLKEADVICTATNSTSPLFNREVLKPGVHINAIGSFQPHMQELDPFLLREARIYVDHTEPCLKESGDFIKPVKEGITGDFPIIGEIGEYCLHKIRGRESDEEITVFKSVGVAIQDYAVAADIYHSSWQSGFGTEIDLFK